MSARFRVELEGAPWVHDVTDDAGEVLELVRKMLATYGTVEPKTVHVHDRETAGTRVYFEHDGHVARLLGKVAS